MRGSRGDQRRLVGASVVIILTLSALVYFAPSLYDVEAKGKDSGPVQAKKVSEDETAAA